MAKDKETLPEISGDQEQPAEPKIAETPAAKAPRKYRYIGPAYRSGIYMPDLVTKITPRTMSDAQIDAILSRYPKLLGRLWESK